MIVSPYGIPKCETLLVRQNMKSVADHLVQLIENTKKIQAELIKCCKKRRGNGLHARLKELQESISQMHEYGEILHEEKTLEPEIKSMLETVRRITSAVLTLSDFIKRCSMIAH